MYENITKKISDYPKEASFLMGCALILSVPPFSLNLLSPLILFIAIPFLMYLTRKAKSYKQSFMIGWLFGSGYLISSWSWVGIALDNFFAVHWWMFIFVTVIMPMLGAVFYGIAAVIAHRYKTHTICYVLIYAVSLFWASYLRSITFDLPWNFMGAAWYQTLPIMQTLSIFGIQGLTFMAILWAALPYLLFNNCINNHKTASYIIISSFIICFLWGSYRLSTAENIYINDLEVQVVQADISVQEKRDSSNTDATLKKYFDLMSNYPSQSNGDILTIWPETSIQTQDYLLNRYLSNITKQLSKNQFLTTGLYLVQNNEEGVSIRNQMLLVNHENEILNTYNKTRPVPWGEYVPYNLLKIDFLKQYFTKVPKIPEGIGPQIIHLTDDISYSPLICFDAAFSGKVIPKNTPRPNFMILISDDDWASGSMGPYQNYILTRLRAIEEGLPIIRAGNIGISTIMDSYGREDKRLDMHVTGVLNGRVPAQLEPTIFSTYGPNFILLILLGYTGVLLYSAQFSLNRRKRV